MNTNDLAYEQKSDKNAKYENVCKYKHLELHTEILDYCTEFLMGSSRGMALPPFLVFENTNPNSRYEYTKKDADEKCAQCADSSKYIYAKYKHKIKIYKYMQKKVEL